MSNLNIITTDEVKGKVTLRLVNVPWDQALDIILRSKALGAVQEGNVLRIAPMASIQKEEQDRLNAQKTIEMSKVEAIVARGGVPDGEGGGVRHHPRELLQGVRAAGQDQAAGLQVRRSSTATTARTC